ncbi:hypothetical protein [Actinophytocola gossypii]|uniref:DUF695 domain-containing protein n=1 Tax=Actinophytocola gossypii TaxID=2812003 RepID=A0ABT2JJ46_9PSEU|nr:hypothetical protein [Actinophytocola gossypii]MCT2587912.1 hypothetical protein [Actinophytocola gossypii]
MKSDERSMQALSENAVIVHFKLSDDDFGSGYERDEVRALGRKIENALRAAGIGELDGDEFGGGEAALFLYGPDANALYESISTLLRNNTIRPDYVILRYGEADDPVAKERRIYL